MSGLFLALAVMLNASQAYFARFSPERARRWQRRVAEQTESLRAERCREFERHVCMKLDHAVVFRESTGT